MELMLKSLKGSVKLEGLSLDMTVEQLKELLHAQHKGGRLSVPAPHRQRLVYKDSLLQDGLLADAGISAGDDLVLLASQDLPQPERAESTPAPNAAAIRKAIVAEARRRGIEGELREEAPAARPRHMFTPLSFMDTTDMDPNLVRLLEQVMSGGGPMVMRGMQAAAGEQEEEEQAEEAAPGPIAAPEPSASNVSQLVDMGFPEPVVRKALVLTKDNVEAALEWVLQHMDDADAAEPPTQEQLQQAPRASIPEAMLNQLTEMGFDAEAASQALRRFGNMDLALAFLLSGGAMRGTGVQAVPAAAQTAAAAGAPSVSAPQAAAAGAPHHVSVAAPARGSEQPAGAAAAERAGGRGGDEDAEMSRASAPTTPSGPADGSDDQSMHDADEGGSLPMESGEEQDEDEYEDASNDEEEDEQGYPITFGNFGDALGSMGSMDLATLNSADMEQLLQGAGPGEMYEHLLFQAGGMDAAGVAGAQDVLLRLMEAPAAIAALQAGAAGASTQEQQTAGAERAADSQAGANDGQPSRSSGEGRAPRRQQQ